MKFEAITEAREYSAREAGYKMDTNADRHIDHEYMEQVRRERGTRFVEDTLDELYDFDGPAYRGDDGRAYAVISVYDGEEFRPLCWQQLIEPDPV